MSARDRLKAFYDLRATEEPPKDREAEIRFRKAVEAAELEPGARVLDIGAKRGGLGILLRNAEIGISYVGTDLSEENIRAGTAAGLDLRLADVEQPLPFEDGSFDCVFCLELLEHLITPLSLLEELRRVLTRDGRAVVSVPNPYSWVEVARELFHLPDPEGHLNAFTVPVMENLAALAGFRVERRAGTYVRVPQTSRLFSTDTILTRSRIYVLRPADEVVFAGRRLP